MDDLDVIFDYIALEDQDAALFMLDEMNRRILMLSGKPRMGAAIPSNDYAIVRRGYRYLLVAPYLVFYRFEMGEVHIGRILHSRQDWLFLLFGQKSNRPSHTGG